MYKIMTNIIHVTLGIIAKEHNSFSEAVTTGQSISPEESSDLINGQRVVQYWFTGTDLIIGFENGYYLMATPGDNKISWSVSSYRPEVKEQVLTTENNVNFELPSGSKISWKWKQVLDSFIGKQFAIAPGDQYLFFHVRDMGEYMLDVFINNTDPAVKYLLISEV